MGGGVGFREMEGVLEEWDGGMEDQIGGGENNKALRQGTTMSALGRRGQHSIANVIYIFLLFLSEVYF